MDPRGRTDRLIIVHSISIRFTLMKLRKNEKKKEEKKLNESLKNYILNFLSFFGSWAC